MRTVIITLLLLLCTRCSNPASPSRPLGPPLVIKGIHGLYYANPAAELPKGVTINPITGDLIYPPDFGHHK